MPWWLPFHLSVIAIITALWVRDDIKDKTELGFIVAEVIATVALVICALAYWLSSVRLALGSAAPWIFIGCVAWLLVATVREIHQFAPDPDLSPRAQLGAKIAGLSLYALVYGPLYYWGFVSALVGSHNGA